jgi:uncharacterized protein (DUF3084 family)
MFSIDSEILQGILAGIAGMGGVWLGIRKKLSDHSLSLHQDKAQVDVINYLKETRQIALDSEEESRRLLDKAQADNATLKVQIRSLQDENKNVKTQNKILSDIVQSLQDSLTQTKRILEEQIDMNNQLLIRIKALEN